MEKTLNNKSFIISFFKSVFVAISCSLVLVLALAIIYRFVSMSEGVIRICNQIIKVLSVLIGCFVLFKKDKSKGMLKGSLLGAIYTLGAFFIFSLLSSSFSFGLSLIYDIIFASIVGIIGGIIFVNIKK